MSIENDTGDMVAGAMALGMLLNQKSQDAQDANYWYNQALGLQQQLNLQREISAGQDRIIAEKNSRIDGLVNLLDEKGRALETTKKALAEQIEYKNTSSKDLSYAIERMAALRTRLMSQSAVTRGLDVLNQKLVEDVSRVTDLSTLPSLDDDARRKIIVKEMEEWSKTGQLSYVPDLLK